MPVHDVNNDFPERFYEEFARLVIAFGRLEYFIKLCIKSLHGQGFELGMLEAESKRQYLELCKQAKQLGQQKLPQSAAFCGLIDQAEDVADSRHDNIHALWTTDARGQAFRVRPKLNKGKTSVDWDRTKRVLVSELRSKRKEVEELYEALHVERKTWPTFVT